LKVLNVKPEDYEDLKAFLGSLNATEYDHARPESVPSGLRPGGG
jgi:hypothetical protein